MSVADPDEIFNQIVKDVELDLPADGEVISVKDLDDHRLVEWYTELKTALLEMGQLIHPTTQEARDLHSSLAAVKIELMVRKKK